MNKTITITVEDSGMVKYHTEGITRIEELGILTHFKNIVELKMLQECGIKENS